MHGGDIYSRQVNMDYSVNLNPLGIPDSVRLAVEEAMNDLHHYPEYEHKDLRRAIADKWNKGITHVIDADNIVCGNGASELIMAAVQAIRPGSVLIPEPAFSGYERAVKGVMGAECNINHLMINDEDDFGIGAEVADCIRANRPELVFVTNPGNPVGRLIERNVLEDIIDACRDTGAYLLVDECFITLSGASGCVPSFDRMMILRAFTKTFAIPGIRLGYMVAFNPLAERIRAVLPEWNISVLAMAAGIASLSEDEYIDRAVKLIRDEREYLTKSLEALGIRVYKSDANYICFKTNTEIDLLDEGILIRDCSDYPGMGRGFYRIAVKKHEENVKLIDAIERRIMKDL